MKKIFSLILSLTLVLGLFTSCASASTVYKIPKTVSTISTVDGQKGSISYSVNGSTLTETAVLPDEDVSGPSEYGELAFLPGDATLNQQLISIVGWASDYPVLPSGIIFSPLLTSGKISKVVYKTTRTYKGKTQSSSSDSIPVKAQNGHVTRFGDDRFSYDTNGNLVSQETPDGTIEFVYDSANRLTAINSSVDLVDDMQFKWSANQVGSYTISNGKIISGTADDEIKKVKFNSDGTYKSYDFLFFAKHSVTYQNVTI